MRDIGKNIRDLRLRAGITQEEMAEKLFVTRQTVSNYENGKSRPDVDMLVKIAELFTVDVSTVIYGIPADTGKRQKYRRVLILTCVAIAFGILTGWLYHVTMLYRNQTYILFPFVLVADIGVPAAWMLTGWWLMELLAIFVEFKQWKRENIRYLRLGLICLLMLILLLLIPELVFCAVGDYLTFTKDSFHLSFPYIPIISDLNQFISIFTFKYPMFYALFGVLFRMIGLLKGKRQ